jgi:hypothetical protein
MKPCGTAFRRTLVLAAVACGVAMSVPIAAQRGKAAGEKTPWGHPDLQGRWTNATLTPLERPAELAGKEFFTEQEAIEYSAQAFEKFLAQSNLTEEAAISGEFTKGIWMEDRALVSTRRTSLVVGPTGRLPAMTAEGQKRAAARAAARKLDLAENPEDRPLFERCLWFPVGGPPMIPGIVYNSNYQIVQTPGYVGILTEMGNSFRIIPLDNRPHADDRLRLWQGDSRGRWDGDTLVVETTNFTEKTAFRGASGQARLIERFRRVSASTILYAFTIEDPLIWTAPWTAEIPMNAMTDLLYEYACHEGNYSLVNILRGARLVESSTNPPSRVP